jgi:hypothetical protein
MRQARRGPSKKSQARQVHPGVSRRAVDVVPGRRGPDRHVDLAVPAVGDRRGAGASEQAIARTKADNDWRIARAEILSKNLTVLSTQGPQTADQRFGVLLSLTRGAILDPELAVSYALELGKDNPSYMRAVLEATAQKNYSQLAQAFKMTCIQRFGVEKAAEICKDDALSERSDAIAQVFQDELEAVTAASQRPSTDRCRS